MNCVDQSRALLREAEEALAELEDTHSDATFLELRNRIEEFLEDNQ